jgi:predicted amidohydrolase YtcJ
MLIKNAEIAIDAIVDIRFDDGKISAIRRHLPAEAGETVFDAAQACVLPALHDHHIHMFSLARAMDSVRCGPPQVCSSDELMSALTNAYRRDEWIRGIDYHESVAGEIDRRWIDSAMPALRDTPLRIQHRTGRLWIFNSAGLRAIGASEGETPLEVSNGELTGRLYDADVWLRTRLPAYQPNLSAASNVLARHGVAGVTDATPGNGSAEVDLFQSAFRRGELRQDILVMGGLELGREHEMPGLTVGAVKFHLREAELPPLAEVVAQVSMARRRERNVAFHCVTLGELAFVMAVLREGGAREGDRIEHASVVPTTFLEELAELKVTVVTQPHFIFERGDIYHKEVMGEEREWLYRARSFLAAQIPLAAGSDAPFGAPNPWISMDNATKRMTRDGRTISLGESLLPEEALRMYLGEPAAPGRVYRRLAEGQPATLCVLDRPWADARAALDKVNVQLTIKRGEEIWRN